MTAIEETSKLLCTLTAEDFVCAVYQYLPSLRIQFTADGDIDADGAYRAYHPVSSKGLDNLGNAGKTGHWFGIETDRNGKPFIQGQGDPAPGYYVSGTAYKWPDFPRDNPRKYIDSESVPFIVVQEYIRRRAKGVVLGCKARVTHIETKKSVECVVGDMGPLAKIGEISIAAANALGIDGNPRTGGIDEPLLRYELWPDQPAIVNGVKYNLIPSKA